MEKDFLYGIIGYNSINIGDEIQSVAASRFLPQIDEVIYREQIKHFIPKQDKKTKCIMNAWWMWRPKNFPPSKWIEPLLISMYVRPEIRKQIFTKQTKEFFLKYGPVGCRDMGTYNWLKSKNIPAYFSGCLTLTLQRNYEIPKQNYILCVDVEDKIVEEIKKRTTRPVYSITRMLSPFYKAEQRVELAKLILRLYHDAHVVVSPRLHVILPSLAMETPVCRIITTNEKVMGETSRYEGFEDFCNTINIDLGYQELDKYDFNNPPQNPNNHLEMRNALIKRCEEFTGHNNKESLILNEPYPFIKLIELNNYHYSNIKRILHFAKKSDLARTIIQKFSGMDRFNIVNNLAKRNKCKLELQFNLIKYHFLKRLTFGNKKEKYAKKLEKTKRELACY